MKPALALLLLLAGCRPGVAYDIPEQYLSLEGDERFTSAVLVDPGRVLFSFSQGSYRQVDADRNQARGRRQYVGGKKMLGLYDIQENEVRILRSGRRFGTGDGNGDEEVLAARGNTGLIWRERRTDEEILIDRGGPCLLDLRDGSLTEFDPQEELEEKALVLDGTPRLVDDQGTLLYEARPRGTAGADLPRRILLRRPDGTLEDLGLGHLRGEIAGVVYLERPGEPGAEALSVATGVRQTLTEEELLALEPALSSPRFPALVRVDLRGEALLYADSAEAELFRLPIELEALF